MQYAPVVSDATRSIETVLEEISFATGDSVKAIDAVSVSGQKMAHLVKETSAVVSKSAHSAYEAKAAMEQLHRTVKEHNETNQGISQNVRDLYGSTQEFEDDLAEVSKKVLNLCNQTEDIFRQLQSMRCLIHNIKKSPTPIHKNIPRCLINLRIKYYPLFKNPFYKAIRILFMEAQLIVKDIFQHITKNIVNR